MLSVRYPEITKTLVSERRAEYPKYQRRRSVRSRRLARCARRERGFLVSTSENNSDADRFSASRSTHPPRRKVTRGLLRKVVQSFPENPGRARRGPHHLRFRGKDSPIQLFKEDMLKKTHREDGRERRARRTKCPNCRYRRAELSE